jgi:hypothetical protein
MVRNYTTAQLIKRVEELDSFDCLPGGYWILGVRSEADRYNEFDDKFYVFLGDKFIVRLIGTTHSGGYGLKNFFRWNKRGTAVIKSNEWYYGVYMKSDGKGIRHHNSVLPCLRQIKPFLYYRDNNKDRKIDEKGRLYSGIIGANFHPNSYKRYGGPISRFINGWSTACQVTNEVDKYYDLLSILPNGTPIDFCLIQEFDPNELA